MRGAGLLRVLAVGVAGAAVVAAGTVEDTRWIVDGAPRVGSAAGPGVSSPLADRVLACPGPETEGVQGLASTGAEAAQIVSVAPPTSVAGALGGKLPGGALTITPQPGTAPLARSTTPGAVLTAPVSGAQGAAVRGTGRQAPALVAVQETLVPVSDRAALTSVPCIEPVSDAWLLAGSGQAGRQEHLVLVNPHDVAVTVDVTLHGAHGPITGVAGQGVVVEPHARTVVLLDALDGAEMTPAAHVVVRGGTVAATLHDGWLDGIIARGGDDSMPTAAPARQQVISGVAVAGESDPAAVRVVVPGAKDAQVTITVLGPGGRPTPVIARRTVRAGASADVSLGRLPAGAYGITVDATAPVVAAAMIGRQDPAATASAQAPTAVPVRDVAWVPGTAPLTDLAGSPLATTTQPTTRRLVVTNPGAAPVTTVATLVAADGTGAPQPVSIPARGTTAVDLAGATSVWLAARPAGLRATVVSETEGGLVTATPLVPRSQSTVPYVVTPAR